MADLTWPACLLTDFYLLYDTVIRTFVLLGFCSSSVMFGALRDTWAPACWPLVFRRLRSVKTNPQESVPTHRLYLSSWQLSSGRIKSWTVVLLCISFSFEHRTLWTLTVLSRRCVLLTSWTGWLPVILLTHRALHGIDPFFLSIKILYISSYGLFERDMYSCDISHYEKQHQNK